MYVVILDLCTRGTEQYNRPIRRIRHSLFLHQRRCSLYISSIKQMLVHFVPPENLYKQDLCHLLVDFHEAVQSLPFHHTHHPILHHMGPAKQSAMTFPYIWRIRLTMSLFTMWALRHCFISPSRKCNALHPLHLIRSYPQPAVHSLNHPMGRWEVIRTSVRITYNHGPFVRHYYPIPTMRRLWVFGIIMVCYHRR